MVHLYLSQGVRRRIEGQLLRVTGETQLLILPVRRAGVIVSLPVQRPILSFLTQGMLDGQLSRKSTIPGSLFRRRYCHLMGSLKRGKHLCCSAAQLLTANIDSDDEGVFFEPQLLKQFVGHILVYANMLFRWQLFHKRVDLLKSVNQEVQTIAPPHVSSGFGVAGLGMAYATRHARFLAYIFFPGVVATCERCGRVLEANDRTCPNCASRFKMPQCSICRLPVKGACLCCPSRS